MNLEEEIKASIEKNLPKQVGDTLRKRLEQTDNLEKENAALKEGIEQSKKLEQVLRNQISDFEKLKMVVTELNARERALEQRELTLEVTMLKAELESEKSKSEFGFNVALGLVRNTNYRKAVFESTHGPDLPATHSGGYNAPQNRNHNATETNTED
jgi:CRISPR/Cas system-associated endonuclease Cas3-HD